MSHPAPAKLLDLLATLLAPLFLAATQNNQPVAQTFAREAIASLDLGATSDPLQAAQTVGFSIAAIAALGQSATPGLPEKQVHQLRSQAERLSRAAARARKSLAPLRSPPQLKPQAQSRPIQPQPVAQPQAAQSRTIQPSTGWANAIQAVAADPATDPAHAAALRNIDNLLRQPARATPSGPRL